MELEEQIKGILFEIGKDIKIHQIDRFNTIIEIDYDKYTIQIMELIRSYLD
jgi:hypothetical protein